MTRRKVLCSCRHVLGANSGCCSRPLTAFAGGCCGVQVLEFVRQHTEYQQAQLAGNSVHIDRAFLQRYMPELAEHFHHRIIDVSTIKELCR